MRSPVEQQRTTDVQAKQLRRLRCGRPSKWRYQVPAWVAERVSAQALQTFFVLLEYDYSAGIPPDRVDQRKLAHQRGVSVRTFQRHAEELEKAKIIRIDGQKKSWCRRYANRYILLEMDGTPCYLNRATNVVEKIKTVINTTTPAEGGRLASHQERPSDHPPAMRKLYEQIGDLYRRLQAATGGNSREETRQRLAAEARRGMYDPTTPPPAPPPAAELEEQAAYRRRCAERREAAQAAQAAAQAKRRQEREELERRRLESMNEPPTEEERARIYRLNLMLRGGGPRRH